MRNNLYAAILVLIAFGGCQESDTPTLAELKCYLVKTNSSKPVYDVVVETTYSLNKENKVENRTTMGTVGATPIHTTSETFEYSPDGKIYKVSGSGSDYYYIYSYNSLGQLVRWSHLEHNVLTFRADVSYNSNGQLIREEYLELRSDVLSNAGHREYSYSSPTSLNAAKASLFDQANTLHFTYEYEYDENPTPLTNMDVNRLSSNVPSVNNITKSTYKQITGSPSVMITTYSYQYGSDGFPTQTIITTPDYVETIDYTYDCH